MKLARSTGSMLFGVHLLGLLAGGCGSAGSDPGLPEALPHGGTGEFRLLEGEETGLSGQAGRVAIVREAIDTASVFERSLLFGGATLRDDAPEPTEDAAPGQTDWSAFTPRVIYRAGPFAEQAFENPEVFLTADQAWEGDALTDPFVLSVDGETLLYYVSVTGGVGLARGASLSSLTKVGDGPVLLPVGGVVPRRPTVVAFDGALLMFTTIDGAIFVSRSTDPETFPAPEPISLEPDAFDLDSPEARVGNASALTLTTASGRDLVRLYFTSERADGTAQLALAASEDGVGFERFERPVSATDDVRSPFAVAVDERVTLLYGVGSRTSAMREFGVVLAMITPAGTRLAEPTTETP